MKLEVEVRLDPELEKLLEKLIEALRDLAIIIGPITGFRVKEE